ncbi:hypothetical protein ABEV74_10780 [Paenibacillus cisolokensis]|uniref:hypothetical protein n=1 Tax=Paenibacillus cisolokensis TaxID=1658519 RepID=UPI003D27B7DA
MTKAELKKVLVIEKLVARQIKVAEAAELLQLSTRQVLRLKKIYLAEGAEGQTLSYGGKLYTLAEKPSPPFEAKTSVEVRETMQGKLVNLHKGQALELRETQKPSRRQETKPETKTASPAPPHKPTASHPWRKPWSQKQIQRSINA